MKKKFKCEIDCANCAAKVEEAVKKISCCRNSLWMQTMNVSMRF